MELLLLLVMVIVSVMLGVSVGAGVGVFSLVNVQVAVRVGSGVIVADVADSESPVSLRVVVRLELDVFEIRLPAATSAASKITSSAKDDSRCWSEGDVVSLLHAISRWRLYSMLTMHL